MRLLSTSQVEVWLTKKNEGTKEVDEGDFALQDGEGCGVMRN